jgi:hypothetical protein
VRAANRDIPRWAASLSKRDKNIAADVTPTAPRFRPSGLATTVATLDREVSPAPRPKWKRKSPLRRG